jgi:fumarylpyruvate hydrolase
MRPVPHVTPPTAAVFGSDARFPVRRILCIGRNYAEHAREMGATGREAPFHFTKAADALLASDAEGGPVALHYPPRTRDLHHEIELVVALSGGGRDVAPADAASLVWGYGLGLDMTRRDLQGAAKSAGRPWASGKDFDEAAVLGPLVPAEVLGHPTAGSITLEVQGAPRQRGDLADLIWSIPELIAELSQLMTLRPGDLIYTGTPAGVGAVTPGDRLVGRFPGLPDLVVDVVA